MIGFRTLATLLMASLDAGILIVIAVEIVAPKEAATELEVLVADV